MTPDVNVLLAAFRADHPYHRSAERWLTEALTATTRGEPLEILPMVAASFVRLATHPKVFISPAPPNACLEFIAAMFACGAEMPQIGAEWPVFERLCRELTLKANAIPDAWIAAAVITRGEHLVTFDRDFRKLLRPSQLTMLSP